MLIKFYFISARYEISHRPIQNLRKVYSYSVAKEYGPFYTFICFSIACEFNDTNHSRHQREDLESPPLGTENEYRGNGDFDVLSPAIERLWVRNRLECRADTRCISVTAASPGHDEQQERAIFDRSRNCQPFYTHIQAIYEQEAQRYVQDSRDYNSYHGHESDSHAGQPSFVQVEMRAKEHSR